MLSNSGTAIMGSAEASGKTRAQEAIMKALDSPLLNDNKISGAKNVLLLIVSGSQEITIDEIGEINDHIQNEAGQCANIIMGVGEDESLGESIAVTIIATGFNADQQNEITNTEAKKVVHSLEEDNDSDFSSKDAEPAIFTPDVVLEKKSDVVIHTLDIDDTDDTLDLIPTTEFLRNINVSYEEVIDKKSNQSEFIINEVKRATPVADTPKEEEQITLTFDLPLTPKKDSTPKEPETDEKVMFTLDEDYKDLDVNSYIEIVPVTEANETGEKRYVLEDLHEDESETKVQKKPSVVEEPVFEKKVLKAEDENTETEQEIDPLTSPISELLKERANERRRKMKDFNYKFSNAKIDEIEREPAYKRQGVKFDESAHSSETITSRLSVGTDDNDDIQLRSNNSFLHDNVD